VNPVEAVGKQTPVFQVAQRSVVLHHGVCLLRGKTKTQRDKERDFIMECVF
jgi:hypothetical protein